MHHPRFLEWIAVPQSASPLEIGPGRWLNSLSWDQAMAAAIQLQWDVCMMQTNLDVLDQYVANALFHVYYAFGIILCLVLVHLSLVRVGLSDWPPKWWRISVSVMSGVLVVRSGS